MIMLIIRRVLIALVTFLGVTLLVFGGTIVLNPWDRKPIGPIDFVDCCTESQTQRVIRQYGFDQPILLQYVDWLFGRKIIYSYSGQEEIQGGILRGELGWSRIDSRSVRDLVNERFPRTFELILWSLPFISTSVWFGMRAAQSCGGRVDRVIRAINSLGLSIPVLALSGFIIILALRTNWFIVGEIPERMISIYNLEQLTRYTGMLTLDSLLNGRPDIFVFAMRHTLLPVFTLSFVGWMLLFKVTRLAALKARQSDELISARSRGLPDNLIAKEYIRPQVSGAILSASGYLAFALFDSALIIEAVFGYPGLGALMTQAARYLDAITVLGILLFTAIAALIVKLAAEVLQIIFARWTRTA